MIVKDDEIEQEPSIDTVDGTSLVPIVTVSEVMTREFDEMVDSVLFPSSFEIENTFSSLTFIEVEVEVVSSLKLSEYWLTPLLLAVIPYFPLILKLKLFLSIAKLFAVDEKLPALISTSLADSVIVLSLSVSILLQPIVIEFFPVVTT